MFVPLLASAVISTYCEERGAKAQLATSGARVNTSYLAILWPLDKIFTIQTVIVDQDSHHLK